MRHVGVRTLREHLSQVLADVEAGEVVVVTKAGQPMAKIGPVQPVAPPEVRRLLESGRATWGGQPLEPLEAVAIAPGPPVANILLDQRGDRGDALS